MGKSPQWWSQNMAPSFCFLAQWFSDNYNKYGILKFLRKPIKSSVYYYVFPSGRFPGLEAPQWGSQNRVPPFCFLALWFSDSCQFNHNYNKYGIWEFLRKPIKPSVYYYVFPSGRFPGLGRLDMAWGNVRGVVCCCSTSRRQIDCLWGYPWRMKVF